MNTKRSKRWNGRVETLEREFLHGVIAQMTAYGDRVQFGLTGTGQWPAYQVVNAAGKAIAFDSKGHLLRAAEDEFSGKNATAFFTIDQIQGLSATPIPAGPVERLGRTSAGRKTASPRITPEDRINNDKYAYFTANRKLLPEGIQEYSQDISKLMYGGLSAEDAFTAIVTLHY